MAAQLSIPVSASRCFPFILAGAEALTRDPGGTPGADLQAAGPQLEQEVVGLAGGQEEQPVPLAGVQPQLEPHRARGIRQRHLHVAVPEERGWGEKGEGQAGKDTHP